jgi:hypothetical protein
MMRLARAMLNLRLRVASFKLQAARKSGPQSRF